MTIVNVYLEDNQDIKELMNSINNLNEVSEVKQSESLAAGTVAAIMLGIKIASITIPIIIKIVIAIRKKMKEKKELSEKEVTVAFKCPDSKEKVTFTFRGIDDEKHIANVVNDAYIATCGKK